MSAQTVFYDDKTHQAFKPNSGNEMIFVDSIDVSLCVDVFVKFDK